MQQYVGYRGIADSGVASALQIYGFTALICHCLVSASGTLRHFAAVPSLLPIGSMADIDQANQSNSIHECGDLDEPATTTAWGDADPAGQVREARLHYRSSGEDDELDQEASPSTPHGHSGSRCRRL